jgi:MarR family transcriptional regulator, transcriptional regulator for hemolysin
MKPDKTPIGLQLAVTSKAVGRAFNAALAEAGGSLPIWLVLSTLRGESWRTQHELARAVGIEGPTLTRHLDGLEAAGLVVRRRHPVDRRAIQVELTEGGEALHGTLLKRVIAFNSRLRGDLSDAEIEHLRTTLGRLETNLSPDRADSVGSDPG